MKHPRLPMLAAIGSVLLLCMLAAGFYTSSVVYASKDTEITLPKDEAALHVAQPEEEDGVSFADITVTNDTVQAVIGSLERPAEYDLLLSNTLFLPDGSQQVLQCRRYVKNGYCKNEFLNANGTVKNTVLTGPSRYYAWEAGDASCYEGAIGMFNGDNTGMLPTYEEVVALDKERIAGTELCNQNGEPCIAVTVSDGERKEIYYISTITGLLYQADFYKGGAIIRTVSTDALHITEQSESLFVTPAGESVLA